MTKHKENILLMSNLFTFMSVRQLFSVKNCVMFVRHFNSSMESMLFSDMFNTHKDFCQEK